MPDIVSEPDTTGVRSAPGTFGSVVLVLLAASCAGFIASVWAGLWLANVLLFDTATLLFVAAGVLLGVFVTQRRRLPADSVLAVPPAAQTRLVSKSSPTPDPALESDVAPANETIAAAAVEAPAADQPEKRSRWRFSAEIPPALRVQLDPLLYVRFASGIVALLASFALWSIEMLPASLEWRAAAVAMAGCGVAATLAMMVARYLDAIDVAAFPEAPALCRGARVVAWSFVLAAVAVPLAWGGQFGVIRALHLLVLLVVGSIGVGLLRDVSSTERGAPLPIDFPVLVVLGSRPNLLAAVLDAAERHLGIDLRSTWALAVVRRSLEPLALGLAVLAWVSTSLTAVRPDEQVLIERFGRSVTGEPLGPGLHVHWPWPIDRAFRLPVTRVQTLAVGHEGEREESGPEDVLWARMHEANEYTLLLGDGRDLITIDATVQYRIRDPRAWRYDAQNPAAALRAIAYRAVMRSTVNRTLAEALSQNVVTLTANMRHMVQRDADALGLGVEVVAFTVGGMHPPVAVAPDYQAVVSAELRKVAAVVDARAYRNATVPAAEASVVVTANRAHADGAESLARSAGEAWAFRTLESGYRTAPEDFRFRRRLEALEQTVAGRPFTVIDTRIPRDGGELWVTR